MKLNSFEDYKRLYNKTLLKNDYTWLRDEVLVRAFLDELNYRQRRFCKKKHTNHYDDFLYYVAYDGRLANIRITGKKPVGLKYLRNGTIYKDSYGIYRSDVELDEGHWVKQRPLLKELNKRWNDAVVERIAMYLDGGKHCTMTIDRDFYTAYEPEYHTDFCLEGDLVTGTSCMSCNADAAQEFYGGIDGCKVVRFENEDGEQVGRCIVYEFQGIRHFIRIYAQEEYARCALSMLRREMKPGDLFGRRERIPGLHLNTNWTDETETLYLDGNHYGVHQEEGIYKVANSDDYTVFSGLGSTRLATLEEVIEDNGWSRCQCCGEWANVDDMIYVDGRYFCSDECADEGGYAQCVHCDGWHKKTDMYEHEGDWYCSDYCLNCDGYHRCEHCGEITTEDCIDVNGYTYCCEDCAREAGFEKCVDCGVWERNEKVYECPDGQLRCRFCGRQKGLTLKFVGEMIDENNEGDNDETK